MNQQWPIVPLISNSFLIKTVGTLKRFFFFLRLFHRVEFARFSFVSGHLWSVLRSKLRLVEWTGSHQHFNNTVSEARQFILEYVFYYEEFETKKKIT